MADAQGQRFAGSQGHQQSVARLLRDLVALTPTPHATNFYAGEGCCPVNTAMTTSPASRLAALRNHLEAAWGAQLLLVGEAPSWRGARLSGVAFTSNADLTGEGLREATATVVRAELLKASIQNGALLWNAFPLHPHRASIGSSNRAPTRLELTVGAPLLAKIVEGRAVVAIGQTAATAIRRATDIRPAPVSAANPSDEAITVRHPSFGGVATFREQFREALDHFGL